MENMDFICFLNVYNKEIHESLTAVFMTDIDAVEKNNVNPNAAWGSPIHIG
jgi:hypothetical protein